MNHRPFEDWLLNDEILTPAQKRELDSHLRDCNSCAALAETGLELRSARSVSPAPGFASRFNVRLAARKMADRRRKVWGAILFGLGGLALLIVLGGPALVSIFSSPAEWITLVIGYLLFLVTSLQTLSEMSLSLWRVFSGFVPPFAWMVIASALAGAGLLWTISIWRFTRFPQGVQYEIQK
jgi:hypothetical protein